jgi:hypothetical protein
MVIGWFGDDGFVGIRIAEIVYNLFRPSAPLCLPG